MKTPVVGENTRHPPPVQTRRWWAERQPVVANAQPVTARSSSGHASGNGGGSNCPRGGVVVVGPQLHAPNGVRQQLYAATNQRSRW